MCFTITARVADVKLEPGSEGERTDGACRKGAREPLGALLVERQNQLRERFAVAHPQVPTAVVPALPGDVHDLDGLREIGRLLAQG